MKQRGIVYWRKHEDGKEGPCLSILVKRKMPFKHLPDRYDWTEPIYLPYEERFEPLCSNIRFAWAVECSLCDGTPTLPLEAFIERMTLLKAGEISLFFMGEQHHELDTPHPVYIQVDYGRGFADKFHKQFSN